MNQEAGEADTSVLAAELASQAVNGTDDDLSALLALYQAAASVSLVKLSPGAFALDAFDGAYFITREKLAGVLGAGKVRN